MSFANCSKTYLRLLASLKPAMHIANALRIGTRGKSNTVTGTIAAGVNTSMEAGNEHPPENPVRPPHRHRRARRRHAGRVAARTAGACTSTRAAAAGQGARGAQAAPVTAVERTTTMRMTASGTRPAPFSFGGI